MILARLLLLLALIGLLASTGFLALVALASHRFRRYRLAVSDPSDNLPRVSLLKPLCGLEPNLEANLTSFFHQNYPSYEIIFGTRNDADPALAVVRKVQARYPEIPVKIVYSGEPDRPNAKVCSLEKMSAAAATDYFIISDSDVHVSGDYIRQVVRPLLKPEVGLVTCLYRGVPTGGMWSRLEALGMSAEMTSGVLVANLLEGMKFALGPTMATRRDVIEAIGGFGKLADYCSDDYLLGEWAHKLGYIVVLSDHVVDHVVINRSFRQSMLHQVRWMRSTRFSRSAGHIGTVLTFAMPFGILGLIASIGAGRWMLGLTLLGWALVNRWILALTAGWWAIGDPRSLRHGWLYPLRDLLGFCYWCLSFVGRTILWRGERYRLEPGGKMARVGGASASTGSPAVAVDDFA